MKERINENWSRTWRGSCRKGKLDSATCTLAASVDSIRYSMTQVEKQINLIRDIVAVPRTKDSEIEEEKETQDGVQE